MKIFLFVALLAVVFFANVSCQDTLDDKQKEDLMNGVIGELEKETGAKCMDELKPNLLNTASKYMTKVINGEPFFKQDGKERSLKDFITHSKLFKSATSEKCKKSFLKGVGKAAKKGLKYLGKTIMGIFTS